MENPHERTQRRLIRRVSHSVERLTEILNDVNKELKTLDPLASEVAKVSGIWSLGKQNIAVSIRALEETESRS